MLQARNNGDKTTLNKLMSLVYYKAPGIRVTFSTRLASASLIVDDETEIPADYIVEKDYDQGGGCLPYDYRRGAYQRMECELPVDQPVYF